MKCSVQALQWYVFQSSSSVSFR